MQTANLAQAATLPWRIALTWQRRMLDAADRNRKDWRAPPSPELINPLTAVFDYWRDTAERQVLFWDTLRQRGDNYIEHARAGKPPLLHFDYDMVLDGRTLAHPVNYALVRIRPPEGVSVDDAERPYVIIDPRAGHGPGIGGFKDDSEVGMALRAGHPVYFCIFFPEPEAGQTLADVTDAEVAFLREVVRRHPGAPKPAIVGNCQGGWAAMLVAARAPELVGALVTAGAPVSYWAGNDGGNPMRYSGGLLGGAWSALLAADLGAGKFDGAHLVSNFENLDPANTLIKKPFHLYDQIDTEPARYLDFERWWGGYFLMNEEEIRWIVENLFIGNNLTEGHALTRGGAYDLRQIRSPIVVFASLGDNITPPQQAINWVLDLYPTTAALKAAGQVVVALEHKTTGHLGIFVSAKIARREHAQIVTLLDEIETLAPGLYALEIHDETGEDGQTVFVATLTERSVEELCGIQRYKRADETPFAAVEAISQLNVSAYQTLVRPWLKLMVNDQTAELGRLMHPLRVQHWAWSSYNPVALANRALADVVRAERKPAAPALRAGERFVAALVGDVLDVWRDVRDASSEALFYSIYGPALLAGVGVDDVPDYLRLPERALQLDDTALLATLPDGDAVDGTIRIGLLLRQGQGSVRLDQRREILEWLLALPVFAGVARDELALRIKAQALLVWRFPAEARKTLPQLFDDRETLATVLDAFDALLATLPDAEPAKAYLATIRGELPADEPKPARPRSRRRTPSTGATV
ncbi:DUF3141 domain-containing protein [Chitinibacteraceae bacterium HSL-7]